MLVKRNIAVLSPILKVIQKCGVVLIVAVVVIRGCFLQYPGEWGQTIHADGMGYYAFLPAIFIYHDHEFKFYYAISKEYYGADKPLDYTVQYEGRRIDKYFSGVAILQLPFFLIAHFLATIAGLPADGYSNVYQLFVIISGTFYLLLGLLALNRLLQYFTTNAWALFITFIIALGTNLFYFATIDISYSHVYSFLAINVFLLTIYRVFHFQDRKYLWLAALSLGFITALRPVNMLILLSLPFVAGGLQNFLAGLKLALKPDKKLLLAALLYCFPVFIQMGLWYWQTGHFIIYPYTVEHFYFDRPMIAEVLFGYSKGWFLWTPLAFIGILGYIFYLTKNPFAFFTFGAFFFVLVYILSCWYAYTYGWCFGAREFIEFLAFPAIGLAVLFTKLASWYLKFILCVVCIFCLALNQVQAYQYKHFILLWDGMTQEKYWKVFCKTGQRYEGIFWGYSSNLPPIDSTYIQAPGNSEKYFNGFEKPNLWDRHEVRDSTEHHTGHWANYIDKENKFSATFTKKITPAMLAGDSIVQASLWVKGVLPLGAQIVVSFSKKSKLFDWEPVFVTRFVHKDNSWAKCIVHCMFPPVSDSVDEMRVFVWDDNLDKPLYIDDFEIDIIKKTGNKN